MWDWFWYFFLYSLVGFVVEVWFSRLTGCPKRDRKCHLFLPLCPVYGLGAVALLLLPDEIKSNPLLLFPTAAVLCTAVEYLVGLFYERVAHVSFWDYSHLPLNLGGKVCLLFSLFWGVLALGLYHIAQPGVEWLVGTIPLPVSIAALVLTAADGVLTVLLLRRERRTEVLRWYDRHPQKRTA